jgi:hypothetical protein
MKAAFPADGSAELRARRATIDLNSPATKSPEIVHDDPENSYHKSWYSSIEDSGLPSEGDFGLRTNGVQGVAGSNPAVAIRLT